MGEQFLVIYFGEDGTRFERMGRPALMRLIEELGERSGDLADKFNDCDWVPVGSMANPAEGDGPECRSYMVIRDPLNNVVCPEPEETITVTKWKL